MTETRETDAQDLRAVDSSQNWFDAMAMRMSRRRGFRAVGVLAISILTGCGFSSPVTPSSPPVRRARKFREKGEKPDFEIEYIPQTTFVVRDLHAATEGLPQDSREEMNEAVVLMADAGCRIINQTEVLNEINSRMTVVMQHFEQRFDVEEGNVDVCLATLSERLS